MSLVSCFNPESKRAFRCFSITPEAIGLPGGAATVTGAAFEQTGAEAGIGLDIPARDHRLLEEQAAAKRRTTLKPTRG